MESFETLIDAWRSAVCDDRKVLSVVFGEPEFFAIHKHLLAQQDFAGLGQLQESLGHSSLALTHLRPRSGLTVQLDSIGSIVKAAHWYRLAGDSVRSRLVARRALCELDDTVRDGVLKSPRPHRPQYLAYALEMLGDATVCVDIERARAVFQQASAEFGRLDFETQVGEHNETYPGHYTSYMFTHFLPWTSGLGAKGQERIDYKIANWLNAPSK